MHFVAGHRPCDDHAHFGLANGALFEGRECHRALVQGGLICAQPLDRGPFELGLIRLDRPHGTSVNADMRCRQTVEPVARNT
jgi:hypothetical protein